MYACVVVSDCTTSCTIVSDLGMIFKHPPLRRQNYWSTLPFIHFCSKSSVCHLHKCSETEGSGVYSRASGLAVRCWGFFFLDKSVADRGSGHELGNETVEVTNCKC